MSNGVGGWFCCRFVGTVFKCYTSLFHCCILSITKYLSKRRRDTRKKYGDLNERPVTSYEELLFLLMFCSVLLLGAQTLCTSYTHASKSRM